MRRRLHDTSLVAVLIFVASIVIIITVVVVVAIAMLAKAKAASKLVHYHQKGKQAAEREATGVQAPPKDGKYVNGGGGVLEIMHGRSRLTI